jgi:hypothetical protein
MASSDDAPKTRNIHIDVTAEFHKEFKVICALMGITQKEYAVAALRERVEADRRRLAEGKIPTP